MAQNRNLKKEFLNKMGKFVCSVCRGIPTGTNAAN